ncbi:MAG: hypothetical protein J0665_11885 [Deltaproteobacteria bacterium]|nr:hypothetical protein [Deltaproteobacteria bacterium]
MANETSIERGKILLKALAQGQNVERAVVEPDGTVTISHGEATLQAVDVADVDLLLTFSDGTFVIIPNGALDAISDIPHTVIFDDSKDTLSNLFKMVGISNPAKAGSLRVVSENIDAAQPPTEEYATTSDEAPPEAFAAPAPMAKVSSGIALTGKGPGLGGSGSGEGEGEVPATVTSVSTPSPPFYRTGHATQEQTGVFDFGPGGPPTFTAQLYTSSNFKLSPSGRGTELPSGAYDPSLASDPAALAVNAAPSNQARVEKVLGTTGNDVIDHNSTFSDSEATWVKTLHLTFNNFALVDSVNFTLTAGQIVKISGFDLTGSGISKVDGYSNVWSVDMTLHADYKENGINIDVQYTVGNTSTPVDFIGDVTVNGKAEFADGTLVPVELTSQMPMTWRNAVTVDEFTVMDSGDQQMMVLPSGGTGYEIHADAGDDIVHAGAGNDLIYGETGNDILYGGVGDDLINGGLGSDKLYGESGSDTATYRDATAPVTADLTDSGNNFGEAVGDTYSSIENLEGSIYADTLTGDSGPNILSGLAGNDLLEGRADADTIDGGEGVDTASYSHDTAGVIVSLLTNTGLGGDAAGDTLVSIENIAGGSGNDTLTGDNGANILNGGGGNNTLVGGFGNDTLIAAGGNDSLNGGAGNDTLNGGEGNNVFIGGTGGDILNGGTGTGVDTADYSSAVGPVIVSFTAIGGVTQSGDAAGDTYNNIENLTGSNFDDLLIGNGTDNVLNGGKGDDTLEGMGGYDSLVGGDGNDTASYAHEGADGVVASLTVSGDFKQGAVPVSSGNAEGDTYDSIENLEGSAFNDKLIGNELVNILFGGDGDDVLQGMAGADSLDGGAGNNTASYENWEGAFGEGVVASLTNPYSNTSDAAGDSYVNIQNLTGSLFGDTLIGNSGVNKLLGGASNDLLEGMAGGDILDGGDGTGDTASYSFSTKAITASLMNASTDNSADTDAFGDSYIDIENLLGSDYADTLIGKAGINTLTGGAGDDSLQGMAGADRLIGGTGDHDVASYSRAGLAASGVDTVAGGVAASLTTLFTSGLLVTTSGDAAGDTYSGIEDMLGSDYADTLIGDAYANRLAGGTGDDKLEGMGGADTLIGGTGTDLNNTASYAHAGPVEGSDGVTVSLAHTNINTGEAKDDSYQNIRNLEGSAFDDHLQGDEFVNTLTGMAGDDVLEGLGGVDAFGHGDVLIGGAVSTTTDLNNTASYANAANAVTVSLLTPDDATGNTGDAVGDTFIQIQNLLGSSHDDTLEGDSISNILTGGSGNDLLIGGGSGDQLFGGDSIQTGSGIDLAGGDTASYATAGQGVVATLTTYLEHGQAVLQINDAYRDSFDSIENLTGSGLADTLIGDINRNILNGGVGNDILEGMGGEDRLIGGTGSDTASYAHAAYIDQPTLTGLTASLTDVATLTNGTALTINSDALGDAYESIENLLGSDYDDTLIGSSGDNILTGGQGNDTLEGLAGADTIIGGLGDDWVSYNHANAAVVSSLTTDFTQGTPPDTTTIAVAGDAANDTYSGIENMLGSGFNDLLIGDDGNNVIYGGMGDDILEGMAGADALYGGNNSSDSSSNDTASYAHATSYVRAALAPLTGNLAGFIAEGMAAGDTYSGIESLEGSNFNDNLLGNSGNNIISGGSGDDILEGLGGEDSLNGGLGNNTASYEHSLETTTGSGIGVTVSLTSNSGLGADAEGDTFTLIQNLTGSIYNDTLTGDANTNIIYGGTGNDFLYGMGGTDRLYGDDGDDSLIDDAYGATSLDGGAGDDRLIFRANVVSNNGALLDWVTDTADGGVGNDTLVWQMTSGPTYVSTDMTVRTLYNNWTGTYLNYSNIENIQTLGSSAYLSVITDNNNNIFTANSSATSDYLDYRNASSALNIQLTDTLTNIDPLTGQISAGGTALQTGSVTGGSGTDTLYGIEHIRYASYYNDVIVGNSLNNVLQGGHGADFIDGGAGVDTAYYDYWSPAVTVSLMTATQNNNLGIVFAGDATGDTLLNIENLYGSGSADILYGNSGDNTLTGNGGNDTLEGLAGGDYFAGSNTATVSYAHAGITGWDTVVTATAASPNLGLTAALMVGTSITNSYQFNNGKTGGWEAGTDIVTQTGDAENDRFNNVLNLTGSSLNDTLVGNTGANTINGGSGDDVLEGLEEADILNGGDGNDWASYQHASSGVTVSLSSNTTSGLHASGDILENIENLRGSYFADTLTGDNGNNILIGAGGANTFDGDDGIDTVSYAESVNGISITASGNDSFTVTHDGTSVDTLQNVEVIIGTSNIDTLIGSNGDDWFDAGIGSSGVADNLDGTAHGVLGDTISFASTSSKVTITLADAVDTNATVADFALGKQIKNFENIVGGSGGDVLTGNSGNNTIDGGLGDDTLSGGSNGVDTVTYANSLAAVTVNLAAGTATGGLGTDGLINFDNIIGSAYEDILTGNITDNTLEGGNGNDLFNGGGGGTDTFKGGSGTDTVSYAGYSAPVNVDMSSSYFSSIENLIGSSYGDTLKGNSLANIIDGGDGANTLTGNGGTDTVSYASSSAGVTVSLAAGSGSHGSFTDSLTGFANVIGSTHNDSLTGDGTANLFNGGAGADSFLGGGGLDTVSYTTSISAVIANLTTGIVTHGSDTDTLTAISNLIGSDSNDLLTGNSSANRLEGGAGNDIFYYSSGADVLDGGGGTDTVSYEAVTANAVNITLSNSSNVNTGGVYIANTENLTGSNYINPTAGGVADYLYGDTGSNRIDGQSGNDYIYGYDGNDEIIAESGHDWVYGGNGNDIIHVDVNTANLPTIVDGGVTRLGDIGSTGGNVMVIENLVAGSYDLTALAAVTNYVDTINVADGVASSLTLNYQGNVSGSQGIQTIVDNANNSHLYIKADSGDILHLQGTGNTEFSIVIDGKGSANAAGEYVVTNDYANTNNSVTTHYTDYTIFNASNTQIAALHWQTA